MDLLIKVFRMCYPGSAKTCFVCLLVCSLTCCLYGHESDQHDDHFHGNSEPHTDHNNDPVPGNTEASTDIYQMEPDYYLNKLLRKYGDGVEMSNEGFKHLLCHLGLGGRLVLSSNATDCTNHFHQYSALPELSFHEHNDNEIHEHTNHTDDHYHHAHELHEGHKHANESHNNDHVHEDHDHSIDTSASEIHEGHEQDGHDAVDHKHDDHEHVDHKHEDHEPLDHIHEDHGHEDHENHDHSEHDSGAPANYENVGNSLKPTLEKSTVSTTKRSITPANYENVGNSLKPTIEQSTVSTTKQSKRNKSGKNKKQKISTAMPTSPELDTTLSKQAHDHSDNSHEGTAANSQSHDTQSERKRRSEESQCLEANSMMHLISVNPTGSIKGELFKELCPVLIYQIDADACHTLHGDDKHQYHMKDDHHDDDEHGHASATAVSLERIPAKVWGFSCVAVIIISLVGLLGVAVIPIMQKVFYNHLLQFLVALAVGALAGDALLHLLPHAISGGHADENHSHGNGDSHDLGPVYKGLCGLLGIYFFFIIERVLTIVTDIKRRRKKRKNLRKYAKEPKDAEQIGERLATTDMCDAMMINIHPNKDGEPEIYLMSQSVSQFTLQGYADEAHSEHCQISFENSQSVSHQHDHIERETNIDGDENSTMLNGKNGPKHSHGHGHSHCADGAPTSVSAVAWMVILGDGIHNFSDGLAIGAAFASSITGGFSTAIAVFCHELPHEIGDFAVLLGAGMSAKQAVFYNCVSSILCFIGMVIGVAIGNIAGASLWIFTVVAGMFLYIALVDMLPELSSVETKKGENPFCHLLLQFLGMLVGGGIMFVIAIYEEDLKTVLA